AVIRPRPPSPLFPYTTLFRSDRVTWPLRCRDRTIEIGRTALMAIVNASPESFSGDGDTDLQGQVAAAAAGWAAGALLVDVGGQRSEEHTSELQSRENLVCRLL